MTATTTTAAAAVDTSTATTDRPADRAADRRRTRAASVVAAAAATGVVFAAGRAAGTDVTITDPGAHAVPHTFVLPEIVGVTLVIGLVGWATLAVLERFTARARVIWSVLATAVVLLSLVPIWIERATTDTRVLLAVIHVVVGLALVPMVRDERRGDR
jgi:hypothetical protein